MVEIHGYPCWFALCWAKWDTVSSWNYRFICGPHKRNKRVWITELSVNHSGLDMDPPGNEQTDGLVSWEWSFLTHPPQTPKINHWQNTVSPLDLFKLFIQTNAEFTTIYCWFLILWMNHSDWFLPLDFLDFQDFVIDYSMLLLIWIRIQSNFSFWNDISHFIENTKTLYKYLVPNCRWDELYFWGRRLILWA